MDEFGPIWDSEDWFLESVDVSDHAGANWRSRLEKVAFACDPCLPSGTVHDSGDGIWQIQTNMIDTAWAHPPGPKDQPYGDEYPAGPREPMLVTTIVGDQQGRPYSHSQPQHKIPIRKQTKKSFVTKGA